jgi:uncharacterized coiled-coil protein SlyX
VLEVEQFFTQWSNTAWAFFSVASLMFIIYRISAAEADKRAAKEARIVELESKVTEGENRINKLSSLCESQIETSKKAYAMAYGTILLAKSRQYTKK